MIKLWSDKAKKTVNHDLFDKDASEWAKKVVQLGGVRTSNKASQIRKFYDEVMRIDAQIATALPVERPTVFAQRLAYLKMLNAKAVYAQARGLVSPDFVTFLKEGIGQVKDLDDLKVFVSLFEAIMGYFKFFEKQAEQQAKAEKEQHANRRQPGGRS